MIVETIDVSDVEPDSRFVDTDLRDDVLAADAPVDLGQMAERSEQLNESGYAPQEATRMIDEQPGDHRSSNNG